MGSMLDSDWSRKFLLRCDWLGPLVAHITTTDVSTTCAVVIFRVKVSCITSVDGIILWLLIIILLYYIIVLYSGC